MTSVFDKKVSFFKKVNFSTDIKFIILFKLILSGLFSSGYQDELFIPFVSYFLENLDNPWTYFYSNQSYDIFPYPPIMLYVLSVVYFFYNLFSFSSIFIENLIFKLPILFSDLLVLYLLLSLFPKKYDKIIIYYFLSPIVFFSAYMHSQLDLLPTAILFSSVFFLINGKLNISAILYGFAIGTKHHTLIALPLFIIYLYKNYSNLSLIKFSIIFSSIFLFTIIPYISDRGFYELVFDNQTQTLIYDSFFQIGSLKLYIPLFVAGILYLRFFMYEKVNRDLLFAYINLLYITFILLVAPTPGWYLWITPSMAIFFIKYYDDIKYPFLLFSSLNIVFVIYFIFFFESKYPSLLFLGEEINLGIQNLKFRNLIFTLLETLLVGMMFIFYKIGVKSNKVYLSDQATVIGIAGDSASGKTTLLEDLKNMLGNQLVEIEGDGDHKWERNSVQWNDFTHLDPKANFLYRQAENISSLKSGKSVMRIDYDHNTGLFTDEKVISSKDFIIICGLHTLYLPKMRKVIDLSIYLDPDENVRKDWKINRDTNKRGYDKKEILKSIENRKKDSEKYILPQKKYGDINISYSYKKELRKKDENLILNITFDSSIDIEILLNKLMNNSISFFHDYSEDLKTQTISLFQRPDKDFIKSCASELILNMEEIVENPKWVNGYRGFVQFIILLVFSEILKIKSNV